MAIINKDHMKTLLLFLITFVTLNVKADVLTQTLRGQIKDEDGKYPLVGVNVIIIGSDPILGTSSDIDGNFKIEKVPLGRIDVLISYMGYEEKVIPNIVVSSGKEVILDIELRESLVNIDEVTVKAQKEKGEVLNEMAIISARSFSVEETKRMAGAFQDPSRMVSSYAGVTNDPSGNNDIIVRGNSPKGILWRMEGIEIPNPNHFADEGATGGPINALNSDLLANSDFLTGAFSPEYGNAMSGVFDIHMRPGNNEQQEYSFGFGVLGTDITMEGPFKKGYSGSYLVNYRYSSLALLDNLGLVDFDGVPKYQDGAFKILLPTGKMGTFSLFALGGKSGIYNEETNLEEVITGRGQYNANLGVVGLSNTYHFNPNTYIKTNLSVAGNGSNYNWEELDSNHVFQFEGKGHWNKTTYSSGLTFSSKMNAKNRVMVGLKYTLNEYDLYDLYNDDELNEWVTENDTVVQGGLGQGFVSWKHRFSEDITIVTGFHSMYFDVNDEITLEPRFGINWKVSPKQSLSFGYGVHSKHESIIAYFTRVKGNDGRYYSPNVNLGLSKAQHFVMGYNYRISKNLNAKIDLYYQKLYNVPVEDLDTSMYSMLNSTEGYVNTILCNDGKGKNYGAEITVERYFANNYYFLITSSLFESTYTSHEGTRNTKFNSNYALNVLGGKEFKIKEDNVLGVNVKVFMNGGRRYIPVDLEASRESGHTEYKYDEAWDKRLDPFFQINLAVNYVINRPKASHEFVIDINNVTNHLTKTYEYYNKELDKVDYDTQLEFLPNIMYRIHF